MKNKKFLKYLIDEQNICERLDSTIKKIKGRISYIKREYDLTLLGANDWQKGKNNLLHHHLFRLQDAKSSNNKFEIAEAVYNYESCISLN